MFLTFLNSSNSKHALGIDRGSLYLKSSPHTKEKSKQRMLLKKIAILDKKNKLRTNAHPSVISDFLFSSSTQKVKNLGKYSFFNMSSHVPGNLFQYIEFFLYFSELHATKYN